MSWWFWLIVAVGILFLALGFIVVLAALSRASQSDWVFEFDPPDAHDKPGASSDIGTRSGNCAAPAFDSAFGYGAS